MASSMIIVKLDVRGDAKTAVAGRTFYAADPACGRRALTRRIEALVSAGRLVAGRFVARQLTAIERGVIATRMLRDGYGAEQVMRVLA